MVRLPPQYLNRFVLPVLIGVAVSFISVVPVNAQIVQQHNVTVTATVYGQPPTTQALILSPVDGITVETTPLVVHGTCESGLLVRVFDNNALAGSIVCTPDGTFTMNITLIMGVNVLSAFNYDFQDQPGPASPTVSITVQQPPSSEEPSQPIIQNDQVQADEITSFANNTNESADVSELPLFSGTFIEPITKLFNVEFFVTPGVQTVFTALMNVIFISIILLPFVWLFMIIWVRFF